MLGRPTSRVADPTWIMRRLVPPEVDHQGSKAAGPDSGTSGARELADTVLEAFKTHRLPGIGEKHRPQNTHHRRGMLLADPRLPEVVDDIIVEFGNALYQDTMDRFIAGQPVDNADLRPVWRNTTQSPLDTYDAPVYEQFYRTVRAANWTLPPASSSACCWATRPSTGPRSQTAARFSPSLARSVIPIRHRWWKGRYWTRATGR